MSDQLLTFTKKGIYCPQANVYIDPCKKVDQAFVTHGHGDHARWGMGSYVCSSIALPVIKHRLGNVPVKGLNYAEPISVNGVRFSFHPAGHIIGSAQIRVEYKGEIWVVSGDYKLENDGLCTPFEPIKCHHFITESTFGLPHFKWKPQDEITKEINDWWRQNAEQGKVSIISAYALGKAQRIIQLLDDSIGKIYTHDSIEQTNRIIRHQGIHIAPTQKLKKGGNLNMEGSIILCPPTHLKRAKWLKTLANTVTASASGWMQSSNKTNNRKIDKGFILSDHADWDGLNTAVKETGAENIYVTHGYTDEFSAHLREQGYNASVV